MKILFCWLQTFLDWIFLTLFLYPVDNARSVCFRVSTRALRQKHVGNDLSPHAFFSQPNLLGLAVTFVVDS